MAISIKYMGSKRSLAPKIARKITREHPRATVLDVFSGMCAVGSELAPRHKLLTNDIHAFAEVVADALFVASDESPESKEISTFLAAFEKNRRALTAALERRLKRERNAIEVAANPTNWRTFRDFSQSELARLPPVPIEGLAKIADYRLKPGLFPYCLASSYFSGAYFGVHQAIEIDSLRYAIDQSSEKYRSRYLSGLIQAASHCAASPGHFAQFLIPRDQKNTAYISRIRQRSVLTRFLAALVSFPTVDCLDRRGNRVFRADAISLLRDQHNVFPKNDLVIYADPPYSRAQYSRYYHVLESLILYDYPACTSKGRYREERFHTNFSRRAGVIEAMNEFVEGAAALNAPLYISYPRDGLLAAAGGNMRDLLRKHYKIVRMVANEPLNHSTMGGAPGTASIRTMEDVYYAGWR